MLLCSVCIFFVVFAYFCSWLCCGEVVSCVVVGVGCYDPGFFGDATIQLTAFHNLAMKLTVCVCVCVKRQLLNVSVGNVSYFTLLQSNTCAILHAVLSVRG